MRLLASTRRHAPAFLLAGLCIAGAANAQYPGNPYPAPYPNQDPNARYAQPGAPSYAPYGDDAGPSVDVGFFYNELSPYGEWIYRDAYGWVWFPRHVPADWRPYTYGRWVQSDYGWTWVSDEPFGWATYHYGRWAWDFELGWIWIPGTVWGPAWVAWQQGGGYVGWAPLPPEVGFQIGVGLELGGIDLSLAIQPTRYTFVPENEFLASRVAGYVVPPARNVTIIHQTTNVTRYTYVDDRVINAGVPVDRIERATGRRIARLRVDEGSAPATGSRAIRGDRVEVYRPPASRLRTVRIAERNNAGLRGAPAPLQPQPGQAPRPRVSIEPTPARPGAAPSIVAPRTLPVQTENLDRRERAERAELARREDEDRRRLARIQQQDAAVVKRDPARAQDLAARHAAELKAQQQEQGRAEEQLRTRQAIARQAAAASSADQNRAHGKPPKNDKGDHKPPKDRDQDSPPPPR